MILSENILFAKRYQLERLLGRGGFSEVWLAKDSYTNLDIALKVYAPGQGMDSNGLTEFSSELAGVFNLNHTNLLKPTHVDAWEGMPYLIMPFCSQGAITNRIGTMSEDEIWRLIHDVASGLAYLHKNDIVHQDIKPDNILLDDSGNYVITDFGISAKARSTLRKSAIGGAVSGGTMAYMGPERFSKQPAPTKASDIWSFGAMVYELITGNVPFGELGGSMQKAGAEIPCITEPVSDELRSLVEQMLAPEPWNRPKAEQLVNKNNAFQLSSTSGKTISLFLKCKNNIQDWSFLKQSAQKRPLIVNVILYTLVASLSLFVLINAGLIWYLDWKDIIALYREIRMTFIIIQCLIALIGICFIFKWEKNAIPIMLFLFTISVIPPLFYNNYDIIWITLLLQYVYVLMIWFILLIPRQGISSWKQCKPISKGGKILLLLSAVLLAIISILSMEDTKLKRIDRLGEQETPVVLEGYIIENDSIQTKDIKNTQPAEKKEKSHNVPMKEVPPKKLPVALPDTPTILVEPEPAEGLHQRTNNRESIYEKTHKAEQKALKEYGLDTLYYENTILDLEKEQIKKRLEQLQKEKEGYKKLIEEEIKNSVPTFGLG